VAVSPFACELLPRLKAGLGLSSHPQKPVPARLIQYGKTEGELTKTSKIVEMIVDVGGKSVVPAKRLGVVLGKAVEAESERLLDGVPAKLADLRGALTQQT